MNEISLFKTAYKKFSDALQYIMTNEVKLKSDPVRWNKVKRNFEAKFERPLDSTWTALSKDEQKRLAPVYLHKRIQTDPAVQKVIKTFNAKVIKVTQLEEEEEDEQQLLD